MGFITAKDLLVAEKDFGKDYKSIRTINNDKKLALDPTMHFLIKENP